jgi:alanyl-tRNA synthetase
MFNNSGMAQFKEYFLGNATPKSNRMPILKNVFVFQENIMTEDVGFDTYHHHVRNAWELVFGDYLKKKLSLGLGILTEVLN